MEGLGRPREWRLLWHARHVQRPLVTSYLKSGREPCVSTWSPQSSPESNGAKRPHSSQEQLARSTTILRQARMSFGFWLSFMCGRQARQTSDDPESAE